MNAMTLAHRLRYIYWAAASLLWLTPLVAMQFTSEVDWSPADFVFAAVMLTAAGGALELALRLSTNVAFRAAAIMAVGTGFLLVWVNAAVGIIGSEDNPLNLLYLGVLAVGFLGAVFSRFKPRGLMMTLYAMALVVMAIAGVAIYVGRNSPTSEPMEILAVNVVLATLFAGSGGLFRLALTEK